MRSQIVLAVFVVGVVGAGCVEAGSLGSGESSQESSDGGTNGATQPEPEVILPVTYQPGTRGCAHREEPFEPVEVWTGYVEARSFTGGSDRVELAFTRLEPGGVEGRATFGVGSGQYLVPDSGNLYPGTREVPGFAYTISETSTFDGVRLQVTVENGEAWCEWCEQQLPYPAPENSGSAYICAPIPEHAFATSVEPGIAGFFDEGTRPAPDGGLTDPILLMDYGFYMACGVIGACACDSEGCEANLFAPGHSIDIRLEGEPATGTLDSSTLYLWKETTEEL